MLADGTDNRKFELNELQSPAEKTFFLLLTEHEADYA